MGMGMSVSPQIWQQFVDLVFQDDLIKCKQNFDVIMDDTFIHSTAEEHMVLRLWTPLIRQRTNPSTRDGNCGHIRLDSPLMS